MRAGTNMAANQATNFIRHAGTSNNSALTTSSWWAAAAPVNSSSLTTLAVSLQELLLSSSESSSSTDSIHPGFSLTLGSDSTLSSDLGATSPSSVIASSSSSLLSSVPFTLSTATVTAASTITTSNTLFPVSVAVQMSTQNDENDQLDRNIYIMPLSTQIFWNFLFGSMVLVAAGGNLIVIWIVLAHKRMRTVTNYFLVNLSIADIMVSTLNVIFNFIYMLNGDWPFGEFSCKATNFIAILSVAASVFTLMSIAIDRTKVTIIILVLFFGLSIHSCCWYMAIVHPLKRRLGRTGTLNVIVMIWFVSSLLSLPNILCSTTVKETFTNGDSRVICYLEWSDGPSTKSRMEYIYNVIILVMTYMLPIVSMSYTYTRVGRELWGAQSIAINESKHNRQKKESLRSKRKIVKMMIVVVVIFGICWAPYHMYFLLAHHYPQIVNSEYAQPTYLLIYWLAMSNSMYNPLVYCWMNSRFRQGFINIFFCNCFRHMETSMLDKPRHHPAARYSCASEACITDMRVRFNGNGITLQKTTATKDTEAAVTSNNSSPLHLTPLFESNEML